MRTIDSSCPRPNGTRVIDVTPRPWWRRVARAVGALLLWLVAVPLLWLIGTLVLPLLLGSVGTILLGAWIKLWRLGRGRRRASASEPWSSADAIDPK